MLDYILNIINQKNIQGVLSGESEQALLVETQSFKIISSNLIGDGLLRSLANPHTYELGHDLIEIRSYQDWWVCEKLLNRKLSNCSVSIFYKS